MPPDERWSNAAQEGTNLVLDDHSPKPRPEPVLSAVSSPDANNDTAQVHEFVRADEVEIPEAILHALRDPNLHDPYEGDYDD